MNAQDLGQQARELLAVEHERDGKAGSAEHIRTQPLQPNKARAVRAIVAALTTVDWRASQINQTFVVNGTPDRMTRQQMLRAAGAIRQRLAPVDLEQFRFPVEAWKSRLDPNDDDESEAYDEADRLLSIIDNAHQPAPVVDEWCRDYHCAGDCGMRGHGWQHSPVVDDTRMARALEWVRALAKPCSAEEREMLNSIEEAIAAYNPNCGGRTVRVVDDGNGVRACSVLTAARAQGVQS